MKSQDIFEQQKKKQLSKRDKSNIGEWDKKIISLCNKINENKNYYTTSSCSGRIVLLKYSDKKLKDAFLFRTHDKISFNELKKVLFDINYNGIIEFQQTSCILHVACKTIEDALHIVKLAKEAAWKRSGVISGGDRYVVELHSTEQMSFPIMNNRKILVDDKYLKLIVEIANNKIERIWKKIERLKKLV
jgi:tRNA wybutosine-synthesizing protein 3